MIDYLVVGLGLAGVTFCNQLEKGNKTFKVISDTSQTASLVAGGLYNPVILKRFTLAWKAQQHLDIAMPFYGELEKKLDEKLNYKLPIFRRFKSPEEQNIWFEASDKKGLGEFLSTQVHTNTNTCIDAPFGYGEVLHTGRIDTEKLIMGFKAYLLKRKLLRAENFDYGELQVDRNQVKYKSLIARRIVFAEGFGLSQNSYFNYLPLNGTKGEYLLIKSPDLREERAIKSSIFSIPLGEGRYQVGATYQNNDKTNEPTDQARKELLKKWDTFVKCEYEIIDQVAGVRPTVIDRRPLVGQHPEHHNLYVLNGLGSRGVMMAPYASQGLYDFIELQRPIDPEMDIARFSKKRFK